MKITKRISAAVAAVALVATGLAGAVFESVSALSFGVSPTKQQIALVPGQTFHGTFQVINPELNDEDFNYKVEVNPFYVNDESSVVLEKKGDYNQITDWITIENPTGKISPNNVAVIQFSIDVPKTAPAGGQYAALSVSSNDEANDEGNTNIQQVLSFSYLIYADVAGESVHNTVLEEMSVPGFVIDGNISGTAVTDNQGNVHSNVEHILQVFPLFSSEEVYTNEEKPQDRVITPDSKRQVTTTWDNTPMFGIYNVKYTVKIDDNVAGVVEKLVIKCPIWLLFIVIFAIIFIIVGLVMKIRGGKSTKNEQ